jgi:hypothetical protein
LWSARCGESRTAGAGSGSEETGRSKDRNRASARLHYYLLEDHLALTLVNAREAKTVPGRKSDVADAEW